MRGEIEERMVNEEKKEREGERRRQQQEVRYCPQTEHGRGGREEKKHETKSRITARERERNGRKR